MKSVHLTLAGRCPLCSLFVDRRNATGRKQPVFNQVRYHQSCLNALVTAQAFIVARQTLERDESADAAIYRLFGITVDAKPVTHRQVNDV